MLKNMVGEENIAPLEGLENTEGQDKLRQLKLIYTTLTEDPIRQAKEKIWHQSELHLQGYMKPRADEQGAKLSHININQSAKSVEYLDQAFFSLIHQSDKLFQINPTGVDDKLTARLISNTINGKSFQIEDFELSLLMAYHQNNAYGFTAGKFVSQPEWDFEYINPFDIYVANAVSYAKIPTIVQKLTWSKEELEEQAEEFDQTQLDEFMEKGKYEYTPQNIPIEQMSLANIKKRPKVNYTGVEIWYQVGKKWRFAVLGCMDVNDGLNVVPIPSFLLSDKETPLWCGHPYCFAGDTPDLRSLYWTGEPEKLLNIEEHTNMFFNLMMDNLADGVNPPVVHTPGWFDTSVKADPLVNPGMGGTVEVNNIDEGKYFIKPPMNPQLNTLISMLLHFGETATFLPGRLIGAESSREETATIGLQKTELASGGVRFKFDLFFTLFLKPLAQKMVVELFHHPPQEDFIAFGGAHEEYIKIQKGNDLTAWDMTKENPPQPYFLLTLPRNAKIAHKFTRDIQVANDIAIKLNQIEQKNLLQYLQILMQMLPAAPEIRVGSDMAGLLGDIFYQIGGNKSKSYFDADKMRAALEKMMSQPGGLAGKGRTGESVVNTGDATGAVGVGAGLKSTLGAGG